MVQESLLWRIFQAKSNVVTIHEQNPSYVNGVITWIYRQDIKAVLYIPAVINDATNLFRVANYFCPDDLQAQIKSRIQQALQEKLEYTIRYLILGKEHTRSPNITRMQFSHFMKGVAIAYDLDNAWAKSVFVDFVAKTRFWIFCDDTFRSMCMETPEFYYTLVDRFVKVATQPFWSAQLPTDCYFCTRLDSDDQEIYWTRTITRWKRLFAVCSFCASIGKLEGPEED